MKYIYLTRNINCVSFSLVPKILSFKDLEFSKKLQYEFVPPPRFGKTSFDSYIPQHSSQEIALKRVQSFLRQARAKANWPWQKKPFTPNGLYLDGGFGVGKTHLLAAAYDSFEGEKIYLSFSELVHLIGVLGRQAAKKELGNYQLYCIDEFELDDPGNTLIVKSFLSDVFRANAKVITTSNTIPEAQGQGRFNAEDFKREIQSIAKNFELLSIDGPDYRQRQSLAGFFSKQEFANLLEAEKDELTILRTNWQELFEVLRNNHPINYAKFLKQVDAFYIEDVSTILLQADALRFVHFIDKLYDLELNLRISGEIELSDLFDESYVNSAYAKKHYRCLSRISELLEERIENWENKKR